MDEKVIRALHEIRDIADLVNDIYDEGCERLIDYETKHPGRLAKYAKYLQVHIDTVKFVLNKINHDEKKGTSADDYSELYPRGDE